MDKKSNEKAEQILRQENCAGEVKTTKNSVYMCNKCTMSSERNTAIQCTRCKQWYHDECFKYCFALSVKSNYLYCFKCSIVLYCNIGNFLAFHHSKNLETVLQDWNTSGELSLQSFAFLDDEKLRTFKDTIKPSQRGFLNTQSNCWVNCALQILLATPLQMILNETTSTIGVLLRNIFQEMLKISTEPLSISSQRVITDACGIKMSRRIHQDIDEFIKTLLHKLMDDDGIGKQVRDIFQISCINLSRCLKCNEMQGNCTLQNTLNIPIIQLPRSQNTDLESLLKHYSTPKVSKGNTGCKNCKRKPRNHCVKFIKSFPCIFFVVLQRCQYHFLCIYEFLFILYIFFFC